MFSYAEKAAWALNIIIITCRHYDAQKVKLFQSRNAIKSLDRAADLLSR